MAHHSSRGGLCLVSETVGASRYADRRIVTGTLQDLIDGAEAFLNRYIAVRARVEGFKRLDIPEYSIEVLREAVINAVVHRDYSRQGESIRVFYYPDRVEVHSPGLLLPGITIEQMEQGVVQQNASKNLLDALLVRAEDVLAFLDDLALPFPNNLAERDLRMIKVQQKISGTFRSEQGATAFCAIRSYLSTMRKQGRSMLDAMTAVFNRSPFPVAWEPGT